MPLKSMMQDATHRRAAAAAAARVTTTIVVAQFTSLRFRRV
jgi:hypothetical protein